MGVSGSSSCKPPMYDIAYITSCPLIRRGENGAPLPIDRLDFETEMQKFDAILQDTRGSLRVRKEIATIENLRSILTMGCTALHYSGHGFADYLAFENGKGEMHRVYEKDLCELVAAGNDEKSRITVSNGTNGVDHSGGNDYNHHNGGSGGGNAPRNGNGFQHASQLRFVFVSACYSEEAGAAFARAGVPHVVAVKWDREVSDEACLAFFKQLYLALLSRKTVRQAFDIARVAVSKDRNVRDNTEAERFLLLPDNAPHDEVIFDNINDVEQDASVSSPRPRNVLKRLPSNTRHMLGREVETQHVFSILSNPRHRMMTVTGAPGIGKTALLREVAHYFYQRARSLHFTGVFYVEMLEHQDLSSYSCIAQILGKELLDPRSEDGSRPFPDVRSDNELFAIVGASQWLLVLDGAERLLDDGRFDLAGFLRDFFDRCPKAKVLIGSRKALSFNCNQTTEKHYELGVFHQHNPALMRKVTTDLLLRVKSRPLNIRDYDGIANPAGDGRQALQDSELIALLGGNPRRIVNVAARMKSSTLGEIYHQIVRNNTLTASRREDASLSAQLIWNAMVDEHYRRHGTPRGMKRPAAREPPQRLPLSAVLQVIQIYFSRFVDPAELRPLCEADLKEIESMIVDADEVAEYVDSESDEDAEEECVSGDERGRSRGRRGRSGRSGSRRPSAYDDEDEVCSDNEVSLPSRQFLSSSQHDSKDDTPLYHVSQSSHHAPSNGYAPSSTSSSAAATPNVRASSRSSRTPSPSLRRPLDDERQTMRSSSLGPSPSGGGKRYRSHSSETSSSSSSTRRPRAPGLPPSPYSRHLTDDSVASHRGGRPPRGGSGGGGRGRRPTTAPPFRSDHNRRSRSRDRRERPPREKIVEFVRFMKFWDWFKGFTQVLSWRPELWVGGFFYGIVSRTDATDLLHEHNAAGTFIVRFSDGMVRYGTGKPRQVSIAWMNHHHEVAHMKISCEAQHQYSIQTDDGFQWYDSLLDLVFSMMGVDCLLRPTERLPQCDDRRTLHENEMQKFIEEVRMRLNNVDKSHSLHQGGGAWSHSSQSHSHSSAPQESHGHAFHHRPHHHPQQHHHQQQQRRPHPSSDRYQPYSRMNPSMNSSGSSNSSSNPAPHMMVTHAQSLPVRQQLPNGRMSPHTLSNPRSRSSAHRTLSAEFPGDFDDASPYDALPHMQHSHTHQRRVGRHKSSIDDHSLPPMAPVLHQSLSSPTHSHSHSNAGAYSRRTPPSFDDHFVPHAMSLPPPPRTGRSAYR